MSHISCVMSHICTTHVDHTWASVLTQPTLSYSSVTNSHFTHVQESRHIYECIMSPICMCYVTHMHALRYTYAWATQTWASVVKRPTLSRMARAPRSCSLPIAASTWLICMCMCVCVHARATVCVRIYIHMCVYACVYAKHVADLYMYVCVHVCVCANTYVRVFAYVHVNIHGDDTYVYMYIYIYIYIYIIVTSELAPIFTVRCIFLSSIFKSQKKHRIYLTLT